MPTQVYLKHSGTVEQFPTQMDQVSLQREREREGRK